MKLSVTSWLTVRVCDLGGCEACTGHLILVVLQPRKSCKAEVNQLHSESQRVLRGKFKLSISNCSPLHFSS